MRTARSQGSKLNKRPELTAHRPRSTYALQMTQSWLGSLVQYHTINPVVCCDIVSETFQVSEGEMRTADQPSMVTRTSLIEALHETSIKLRQLD